jgi:hypothetical protein
LRREKQPEPRDLEIDMSKASEGIENKAEKLDGMARLLIECRDALPAIKQHQLRLYNISPTLADRIDETLEPWVVPSDTPGAI